MPELSLDYDQRHALMCHLDGMGVTELMGREASPHARFDCGASQLFAS